MRGVSLITCGCEAEGHNLHVDKETVGKLFELAKARGKVPVNLDHGSGIEKMNGYVFNFRMDGDKLRGDWQLLENHDETPLMMERAAKMPDCFGLSVAFKGKGVAVAGGKQAARAEKLLSVDCVTRPAANAGGLFSALDENVVDSRERGMPNEQHNQQEPSIADVLAAITQLNQRMDSHEQAINEISQGSQEQGEDGLTPQELEALHRASDEDLAELGITRDEVDAAVDQFNSQFEGDGGDEGEGEGQYQDQGGSEGAGELAGVGAGEGGGGSTALNALYREVIQLKSQIASEKRAKQVNAEELEFSEVASKIEVLAAQRVQAIELAERLVSENEALHMAVRTGTRPVRAGIENGVRLFGANTQGELHVFQAIVKEIRDTKKCSEGQAILFAMKEPNGAAMHADWLQSQTIRG